MQVSVKLDNFKGYAWQRVGDVCFIGTMPVEEAALLQETISDIAENNNAAALAKELKGASGFFACVIETPECIALVADHMGSFPLFYSVDRDGGVITVSDCPQACASKTTSLDDEGILQFRYCFTTMSDNTLWFGVKEVEGGSCVAIDKRTGLVEIAKYFEFTRSFADNPVGFNDLDHLVDSVFGLIKKEYGTRQIILPVTSGIDSRTIAVLLKEFGLEDVYTFSIGSSDSDDVRVGQEVAKNLGFSWRQIEISPAEWKGYLHSVDHKALMGYSLRGGRINHALMGHALLKLSDLGEIDSHSVFMPGHSGCIMGGGNEKSARVSLSHFQKNCRADDL